MRKDWTRFILNAYIRLLGRKDGTVGGQGGNLFPCAPKEAARANTTNSENNLKVQNRPSTPGEE